VDKQLSDLRLAGCDRPKVFQRLGEREVLVEQTGSVVALPTTLVRFDRPGDWNCATIKKLGASRGLALGPFGPLHASWATMAAEASGRRRGTFGTGWRRHASMSIEL
jgi:hypothetical protein